ncbi:MAG: multicopper oxidase domain-containing protein [Acidimicrobiales bacterium]|nr:multicopper oxidase domain-containing protein [Acidimicrobiales bacterium]
MTSTNDRPPPRSNAAAIAVLTVVAALALAVGLIAVVAADGGGGTAAAGGDTVTVDVTLTEFAVDPASIDVAPGTEVIVNVTNAGEMEHDLKADGTTGTEMLAPGESVEGVSLGTFDESSVAWCTVPGHRESGMEMAVNVTGEAHSDAEHAAAAESATPTGATIDPAAAPEADWEPFDPSLEPAPGATEHEITLHAVEAEVEVAPGVTQQAWTFVDDDGGEPRMGGPVLRGHVGDLFTVTLVNDGEVDHSIDFHASRVAWDDEMRSIGPGESLVYQFRAEHAGAFMYHCGTAPALHHIGNGMYGAIIIDPPELAPVDREFVVVQSELYLGEQGQPGSLDKMVEADWDAVVFNGYYDQYKHAPIRVEADERIRVWVIDDGPSENSAFHIVGTVFDTVWKEGSYLLQPDERQGGSQVLDLQPAQGGFVEFSFAEEGFYPMVTHKFANVGRGALGLFQAGDVEMPGGAGH